MANATISRQLCYSGTSLAATFISRSNMSQMNDNIHLCAGYYNGTYYTYVVEFYLEKPASSISLKMSRIASGSIPAISSKNPCGVYGDNTGSSSWAVNVTQSDYSSTYIGKRVTSYLTTTGYSGGYIKNSTSSLDISVNLPAGYNYLYISATDGTRAPIIPELTTITYTERTDITSRTLYVNRDSNTDLSISIQASSYRAQDTSLTPSSGSMSSMTVYDGESVKVTWSLSSGYTGGCYRGTSASATTTISSGYSFTISSSMYYVVTRANKITYSITFNGNGTGSTGLPSTISNISSGGSATLPSTKPSRTAVVTIYNSYKSPNPTVTGNFTFSKWNTKADGTGTSYNPGASVSNITSNITLYAIWSAYTGTVTLPTSSSLTRDGYVLSGYSTSSGSTTISYTPGQQFVLAASINIYAIWIQGTVRIYYNNAWRMATPYIYYNNAWHQAIPYVYNGTAWKIGS